MANASTNQLRDLRDGEWYWIEKGVIRDHAKRIGTFGIAVYNLLASMADSRQSCFPSQKYIAERLGYSRGYVNRAIRLLEKAGLIRVEKRDRYHCVYRLLRVSGNADKTQMSLRKNSEVNQFDTNNSQLTRTNNNIVDENSKIIHGNPSLASFKPTSREELLALDLAEGLYDPKNLRVYLAYARKYPEPLLRRLLGEVKEIPSEKLKKGRAALFNYLIKKHAQATA